MRHASQVGSAASKAMVQPSMMLHTYIHPYVLIIPGNEVKSDWIHGVQELRGYLTSNPYPSNCSLKMFKLTWILHH